MPIRPAYFCIIGLGIGILLTNFSICLVSKKLDLDYVVLADQERLIEQKYDNADRRLVKLEAHFSGHKVIIAKNGVGLSFEPCVVGTKNCVRDSVGITINNSKFMSWYTGIEAESGMMQEPK